MALAPEYWITPSQITIGRMIAALPQALCIVIISPDFAFWPYLALMLSDSLDGWLARHTQRTSELGAKLDPAADKVLVYLNYLVVTSLVWGALDTRAQVLWIMILVPMWILDIWSTLMRSKNVGPTPANNWGKVKTICQMLAALVLIESVPGAHEPSIWDHHLVFPGEHSPAFAIALAAVALGCSARSIYIKRHQPVFITAI